MFKNIKEMVDNEGSDTEKIKKGLDISLFPQSGEHNFISVTPRDLKEEESVGKETMMDQILPNAENLS